jgi:hypothetical protein
MSINSNVLLVMNAFDAAIDLCISVFKDENEYIKNCDISNQGRIYGQELLKRKAFSINAFEDAHLQLEKILKEKIINKEQLDYLKQRRDFFADACQENFSYLQIAESLSLEVLDLFSGRNLDPLDNAYTASGLIDNQIHFCNSGIIFQKA